jgi:hypothetical protein
LTTTSIDGFVVVVVAVQREHGSRVKGWEGASREENEKR